jgi:peptidyl-prolyl cis-trans isomerase B (cyclophilin B)
MGISPIKAATFLGGWLCLLPVIHAKELAVIQTSEGRMVVEFWPDAAPKTVQHFQKWAREQYYDGVTFHRIVRDFMIQTGDPSTKTGAPAGSPNGPGYTIPAEFHPRPHVRGVLSMARYDDPDSAGSQFFICLRDAPHLDGKYTAFGRLIQGDYVLEKIGQTPTEPAQPGGENSRPTRRVWIDSIRIVKSKPPSP